MNLRPYVVFSPYSTYSRAEWARLRDDTPLTLTEADLENLSGLTERVSTAEVVEIYLPLSRLLNLYVESRQELHGDTENFLGKGSGKMPFIIGLAGSVAAGKSTSARVLQALLARWQQDKGGTLLRVSLAEAAPLGRKRGWKQAYPIVQWSVRR